MPAISRPDTTLDPDELMALPSLRASMRVVTFLTRIRPPASTTSEALETVEVIAMSFSTVLRDTDWAEPRSTTAAMGEARVVAEAATSRPIAEALVLDGPLLCSAVGSPPGKVASALNG